MIKTKRNNRLFSFIASLIAGSKMCFEKID